MNNNGVSYTVQENPRQTPIVVPILAKFKCNVCGKEFSLSDSLNRDEEAQIHALRVWMLVHSACVNI